MVCVGAYALEVETIAVGPFVDAIGCAGVDVRAFMTVVGTVSIGTYALEVETVGPGGI